MCICNTGGEARAVPLRRFPPETPEGILPQYGLGRCGPADCTQRCQRGSPGLFRLTLTTGDCTQTDMSTARCPAGPLPAWLVALGGPGTQVGQAPEHGSLEGWTPEEEITRGNPSVRQRPGTVCRRPRKTTQRRSLSKTIWAGVPRPSNPEIPKEELTGGLVSRGGMTRGNPSAWPRPGTVCRRPGKTTQRRSLSRTIWAGVSRPSNPEIQREELTGGLVSRGVNDTRKPFSMAAAGDGVPPTKKTAPKEIPQQDNLGRCASAE